MNRFRSPKAILASFALFFAAIPPLFAQAAPAPPSSAYSEPGGLTVEKAVAAALAQMPASSLSGSGCGKRRANSSSPGCARTLRSIRSGGSTWSGRYRPKSQGTEGRYETAQRALKIFDEGVLKQSQENLRIVRAAYDLGELRILDVINEQRRLIETQRTYTDLLREAWLPAVDVERAAGALLF